MQTLIYLYLLCKQCSRSFNQTILILLSEMEIIPEGKNFRLVQDNELPELLLVLEQYMPEAVKVRNLLKKTVQSLTVLEKTYTFLFI